MSYRFENYSEFVPLIEALPVGTYYNAEMHSVLEIQASGDAVSAVRAAFPGQIWQKVSPTKSVDWWEYHTTMPSGIKIRIYADWRGPLSCKKVETQVTTTEEVYVPVTMRRESREVTRTVVRWECPEVEAE
jgi:hypothetical protein